MYSQKILQFELLKNINSWFTEYLCHYLGKIDILFLSWRFCSTLQIYHSLLTYPFIFILNQFQTWDKDKILIFSLLQRKCLSLTISTKKEWSMEQISKIVIFLLISKQVSIRCKFSFCKVWQPRVPDIFQRQNVPQSRLLKYYFWVVQEDSLELK